MPRARPPVWLKRALLPAWNGSHRLGLRAGEYLGAVRHGRFGRCTVCGRFGPWLYQPRVIPDRLAALWGLTPTLRASLARKESSSCAFCGAKLRARRLAGVLLDLLDSERKSNSVAHWVPSPSARALRVAEINRIDGLHAPLSLLPGLAFSDYGDEPNVHSEDLTQLSYPDAAFDLVLTSETLEHVPDLQKALSEIHRVLIPGGLHLFTIPMLPDVSRTFTRSTIRSDGTVEHHVPEIRHPGGDVGYPVFTEFGADFPAILEREGFEVRIHFGPVRDDDIAQVWETRKRV